MQFMIFKVLLSGLFFLPAIVQAERLLHPTCKIGITYDDERIFINRTNYALLREKGYRPLFLHDHYLGPSGHQFNAGTMPAFIHYSRQNINDAFDINPGDLLGEVFLGKAKITLSRLKQSEGSSRNNIFLLESDLILEKNVNSNVTLDKLETRFGQQYTVETERRRFQKFLNLALQELPVCKTDPKSDVHTQRLITEYELNNCAYQTQTHLLKVTQGTKFVGTMLGFGTWVSFVTVVTGVASFPPGLAVLPPAILGRKIYRAAKSSQIKESLAFTHAVQDCLKHLDTSTTCEESEKVLLENKKAFRKFLSLKNQGVTLKAITESIIRDALHAPLCLESRSFIRAQEFKSDAE